MLGFRLGHYCNQHGCQTQLDFLTRISTVINYINT
jgi:hypothetical protein